MGIETIIGAGASLVGGAMQSGAASDAADAQAAGTAAGIAENRRQFDLTRSDYAPARAYGNNALAEIARYLGLPKYSGPTQSESEIRAQLTPRFTSGGTPGGYTSPSGPIEYGREGNSQSQVWSPGTPGTVDQTGLNAEVARMMAAQPQEEAQQPLPEDIDPRLDPGYQFGLDQGMQGLDRKIAAGGGRVSGAALKAATQYATNYATTGYSAAYQRRQDRLNRLQALAGIGQTATGGSAAAGQSAASQNAQLLSSQGDATGAAALAQGNIWGNTANQLGAIGSKWAANAGRGTPYNPGVGGLSSGGSPDGYW